MGSDTPAVIVDPAKAFEQRVMDKVRADIGALIPDEVLAGLVQKAVHETFFKPSKVRKNPGSNWDHDMIDGPSWFQEEVSRQVKPLLVKAVGEVVEKNREVIEKAIAAELERDKLLTAVSVTVAQHAGMAMQTGVGLIVEQLRQSGVLR